MSDTVQEIKDRLNITEVINPYVKLTRAGKYHKGLCPFHKEKTPSFMVSPDRGIFHCFGCGSGGDIFSFIEEIENIDFRGALALLAEKAGVPVQHEVPGARDLKEKLFASLEAAACSFTEGLEQNKDAQEYLRKRGLTDETMRAWRIGYAPGEWRLLYERLLGEGYSESTLIDAGLIKRPEDSSQQPVVSSQGAAQNANPSMPDATQRAGAKRPYDRFRSRIMFPISDSSGRVIAFSGRIFPNDEGAAKYLNSPETAVFSKSHVLHGLTQGRQAIRSYGFAIVVEGQMDLLAAHQAGYTNTVALSGTGFTEGHATLLKRYTENLVIAFDGDRAGIAAAGKAAQLSLKAGLNVKLAALPPGEDPADLIVRDFRAWKNAVKGAVHVVDFYLAHLTQARYDARTFKLEVSRTVLPYVALVGNAIDREHFIGRVAGVLAVPEEAVREELDKITSHESRVVSGNAQHYEPPTMRASSEPFLSREDTLERFLLGIAQALMSSKEEELGKEILSRMEKLLGEERIKEVLASPEDARVAVIEGDLFLEAHKEEHDLRALIESIMLDLEKETRRSQYRDKVAALKQAEASGDQTRIDILLKEINQLSAGLS